MLSDEEWAALNDQHQSDPQPVAYRELDVRADSAAMYAWQNLQVQRGLVFLGVVK